ncbi:MAG: radical SAM protein, partial [Ruminococcaceae bacterium]|nr:radical SAM protein [Oscillospiraceae bacterium]
MEVCNLCPRHCGADRINKTGFCGVNKSIKVARASLHMWEEPVVSGTRGSGTVFFSGCSLGCVYCQN